MCADGCVTPLLKTLPCPQGQTQPLLLYKIGCDPATPYLSPSIPIPPDFNILFYLFIFGCDGPDLRRAGVSLVVAWRFGSRSTDTRLCSGGTKASLVVVHGLICPVARGILVPWPGIEPASPGLEGRFLRTGPPGNSLPLTLTLFCVL